MKVTSAMESRIIIDAKGGEFLTGYGDLLYKANGSYEAIRLQSCYISSDEMKAIGQSFIKPKPEQSEEEDMYTKMRRYEKEHPIIPKQRKGSFFKSFFKKLF